MLLQRTGIKELPRRKRLAVNSSFTFYDKIKEKSALASVSYRLIWIRIVNSEIKLGYILVRCVNAYPGCVVFGILL